MGSKPFRFKNFSVAQSRATHKVGTDGVLLGAWVNVRETDNFFLDIGTGSAVIALMLAQRSHPDARIDAIDIEGHDVEQARENVANSPWPQKITVHLAPVQEFHPQRRYDLIITNPPYFVNRLPPPDQKRRQARHATTLSFEHLLESISRLLANHGRAAVILPLAEGLQFLELARAYRLFPLRKTTFRSRPQKAAGRLLMELAFEGEREPENEIILYDEGETRSAEYKRITGEFYLDNEN